MSITETHDERATSIEMASALTLSVSSLHDHNDALVAENDSLRTAFTAVASGDEHLRQEQEKLVRQRDSAMRKAELAEVQVEWLLRRGGILFQCSTDDKAGCGCCEICAAECQEWRLNANSDNAWRLTWKNTLNFSGLSWTTSTRRPTGQRGIMPSIER